MRVCFVCLGNICRSPMAEAVLRRLASEAGLDVEVASAGTGGWHVGGGADARALAALRGRGYDGAAHRARQFARDWFDRYDLVLALDRENEAHLRELARGVPGADAKVRLLLGDRDVPDPYHGGADRFDHVLDLVEEACRDLLAELAR
ncbi:MAG TPA: low molecular weight protein-tyrosine-phosphatase [Mycobacteriales bacterium]